jgi:hypothetical protein
MCWAIPRASRSWHTWQRLAIRRAVRHIAPLRAATGTGAEVGDADCQSLGPQHPGAVATATPPPDPAIYSALRRMSRQSRQRCDTYSIARAVMSSDRPKTTQKSLPSQHPTA